MINKDRYNFDKRFNEIAQKVLTFNNQIPSNLQNQDYPLEIDF